MHCGVVSSLDDLCQTFSWDFHPSPSHFFSPFKRPQTNFQNILMLRNSSSRLIIFLPPSLTSLHRCIIFHIRSNRSRFFPTFNFRTIRFLLIISHQMKCIRFICCDLSATFFCIIFAVKLLVSHYQYYK